MPVCEKALPATRGVAGNHVSYVPVLVRVDFTSRQTLIQDLSGVGGRSVVLVGWTVPPGYEVPDGPDEQTSEGDHDEPPSVRPHQCMPPPEYHIIANHLFVGPTLPWSACRNRSAGAWPASKNGRFGLTVSPETGETAIRTDKEEASFNGPSGRSCVGGISD